MMILFRRLDRTNLRMAKLRRYSARVFDDFKKMAELESRKFQDATIEIDVLIKKSSALAKNMAESIKEIETRLKGLDIEKTNLKKVEEDIKVISTAAKDLNKQIQFIANAKENFTDMTKKVTYLSENVDNLNNQMIQMINAFEDKLRERSREISEEFYAFADNLKGDVERRENEAIAASKDRIFQLSEEFTRAVVDMERRVSESSDMLYENFKQKIAPLVKVVENADNLSAQISNMKETFSYMENTFFDEFKQKSTELKTDINDQIDKLTQKLKNVESNIDESKSKLINTFENEVEKVRTEIDNLSIHAVSKKDEIVQAARREAEAIRKRIDEFEDRFTELEARLIETAESKIDAIDSEYQTIESRINSLLSRMREEETSLTRRLTDIKEEIIKYEQSNDVFGKTDALIKRVDSAVADLSRTLEEAQKESKELQQFVTDVEQIKELKKTADKEIRSYYAKKEKLADIENEIKHLMEVNDHVIEKTEKLLENISKVDAVNSRIDALSEAYAAVERRIKELREYEDVIARNLDAVNKSDIIIQTIDSRIKAFEKVVERSDKRIDKIAQNLRKVEEETIILKTKESDIRELRDRLSELDGLSDHMEERIKQIYAMFQKVEKIRKDIDQTDSKLQNMFDETDRKMKEFSDFIQAVDNNIPILKQVKGDIKNIPAKNLNDNIIKTVRELSNKGWDPEAISKKLMIDENSVRFIINTTLL